MADIKFVTDQDIDKTKGLKIDGDKLALALNTTLAFDETGAVGITTDTLTNVKPKSLNFTSNTLELKLGDDTKLTADLSGLAPTADVHLNSGTLENNHLKLNTTDSQTVDVDLTGLNTSLNYGATIGYDDSLRAVCLNSSTGVTLGSVNLSDLVKIASEDSILKQDDRTRELKVAKPTVVLKSLSGTALGYAFAEDQVNG